MTVLELEGITNRVASLFDIEVVVEAATPSPANLDELFPAERVHIAPASRRRQAEFAAARVCARRALARLGIEPGPLVPHDDRSPRWPEGTVGSISHTRELCIVVAAKSTVVAGIGLDLESPTLPPSDIEDVVCTFSERLWLDQRSAAEGSSAEERRRWVKVIFAAKEAFYKCQYPRTKAFLEFQNVELDLDPSTRAFTPRILRSERPLLDNGPLARGRWGSTDDGLVIATAALAGATDQ
jgi:4'-phosphopantetheinyl transferase EntD